MKLLVDSCILIDHLLGQMSATAFLRSREDLAISRITWIEVMVGAADDDEAKQLRAFLAAFHVYELDQDVAEEAVRVRRGRRLKLPDALILATARVHGRRLATRNTRDFTAEQDGVVVPYAFI